MVDNFKSSQSEKYFVNKRKHFSRRLSLVNKTPQNRNRNHKLFYYYIFKPPKTSSIFYR